MAELIDFTPSGFCRGTDYLFPDFARAIAQVNVDLAEAGTPLKVFETFRSAKRQAMLFGDGRKTTLAQPWFSAHQYGLAADYAWLDRGKWRWDPPNVHWARLRHIAEAHGLCVPSPGWDPGHVEHPAWKSILPIVKTFSA